jgi:hypothetical protein
MVASETDLAELLTKLRPDTCAVVRETWLAADPQRLLQLLTLSRTHQDLVARRVRLGFEWDAAMGNLPGPQERAARLYVVGTAQQESRADADQAMANELDEVIVEQGVVDCTSRERHAESGPSPVCEFEQVTDVPSSERQRRQITRVPLSTLRPNAVNSSIYRESLADEGLQELADHIARHGQQEPIIADASLTILDGERRFRALRLLGAEYADVIIDTTERSCDEIEDLVLDAFSLKRKPSVFEQLRLYDAAVRSYSRRYGRAPGRPRKLDKILSGFWDGNRVKEEAAAAAGLGSRETARQAVRVYKYADADTKRAMLSREVSISAAYALLPKRTLDMPAREDGGAPLQAIGTRMIDGPEDKGDADNDSEDTSPDSAGPTPPAAKQADGLDEGGAEANRAERTRASGNSSPDPVCPPSLKASGIGPSVGQREPRVPTTHEPSPDESNVEKHPPPQPQGGDVAVARIIPPRDLETTQERRTEAGGHSASKAAPRPTRIERSLIEIEAHGDNLAQSTTDQSGQALGRLVAQLRTWLARWELIRAMPIEDGEHDVEDDDESKDAPGHSDELDDNVDAAAGDALEDNDGLWAGANEPDNDDDQVSDDGDSGDDAPKDEVDVEVARILGTKRR